MSTFVEKTRINEITTKYIWQQLNALYADILALEGYTLPNSTPVNAVAASRVLTVSGLPSDLNTVTVGGKTYRWRDAIGSAVAATGTLTVSGLPVAQQTITIEETIYRWMSAIGDGGVATGTLTLSNVIANNETITIGSTVYRFKTALTEVKATGTLTLSANVTDGNSVTIGSTKYTFKETLASAYDVKIGASASDTIDNLIAAINGAAGEGTLYGTDTDAHTSVVAAAGAGDTMTVTAINPGTAGNSIATTELSGVCSWGAGTLGSGVNPVANEILVEATATACIDNLVNAINWGEGEGTKFSTGTVVHPTVTAERDASTMIVTANEIGYAGNIASTETCGNASWGNATLTGGIDAQQPFDVLIGVSAEACIDNLVAAITAGTGEGTKYGTDTPAHTLVTAAKATASTMTATALTAGEEGNSIGTTEASTNCAWGGATLSGGETAQTANDVLIGVSAEACIDNLVAAITKASGEGTTYGTGTTANANVTAAKASAATMTATALVKGIAGNSIACTEVGSNTAWAGATLSGGVDGTVGNAGQIVYDSDYIYICTADNTIADANWKKATLA